jgi:hypothetical protein
MVGDLQAYARRRRIHPAEQNPFIPSRLARKQADIPGGPLQNLREKSHKSFVRFAVHGRGLKPDFQRIAQHALNSIFRCPWNDPHIHHTSAGG